VPRLRDGPGDGAFVGDTEDDTEFSAEFWHRSDSSLIYRE
jgi:hypothetical protein